MALRERSDAAGRQAKANVVTPDAAIMDSLVKGVTVDDAFIFVGGRKEFYKYSGCEGDFAGHEDISTATLQTANDMQALRKDFDNLQATHVVNLFGPEKGREATPDEEAVSGGTLFNINI